MDMVAPIMAAVIIAAARKEFTALIITISSDEGCMKPDPEFYNKCCERYHLDKAQSVMIGNELNSDMMGGNHDL